MIYLGLILEVFELKISWLGVFKGVKMEKLLS